MITMAKKTSAYFANPTKRHLRCPASGDRPVSRDLADVDSKIHRFQLTLFAAANVITRAVGSDTRLEIDRVEGDIAKGDAFLLASDGLTRLVSDQEILSALEAADLEKEADQMIAECLARGAPDNVTFVIMRARPA